MNSRRMVLGVCIFSFWGWFSLPSHAQKDKRDPIKGSAEKSRRFTPDQMDRLVGVSDPQISPDGKSIVIGVSRINVKKNRYERELVLVDIATGKQRPLTFERQGLGQARWSPTGDRLAFLAASESGKHQIFVMPMQGGDARRITDAPEGVQHFAWSPDGTQLAYATADERPKKKEENKADDAFEIGNDSVFITKAVMPVHMWLIDAAGTKARRLTSGSWSLPSSQPPGSPSAPLSWSPDGKALAFVRQATPHYGDSDQVSVQILDVQSGSIRPLTSRKSFESYPIFSPDGKHLAYVRPRDGDFNNVKEWHLAPVTGGEGVCLTRALDRHLTWCAWMPDGKNILVGGHDGTRVALWHQTPDGKARKLDLGDVNPSGSFWIDANVDKKGAVAFAGNAPNRPPELYYLPSVDATPKRLTDFNKEVTDLDLGKVETITWKFEGFHEDGVLIYPPDFSPKKKYPLVLYIHGGPTSTSTEAFSAFPQTIAGHGYVVFMPNYRGSDNLGNAYQRAIFNDAGAGPGRDVMAGLEEVKKRGFVDEARIAVSGWSYGGYMTVWLTSHYHCWKTAIAGAAAIDRNDQYNLADYNVLSRHRFGGSPWTGEFDKAFREQSPITHAPKIKTPTLILATTGDARVPITQSFRLYHALKDNNVPVRFFAYPVSGHYPSDPYRRKDLAKRWLAWLDEYLK